MKYTFINTGLHASHTNAAMLIKRSHGKKNTHQMFVLIGVASLTLILYKFYSYVPPLHQTLLLRISTLGTLKDRRFIVKGLMRNLQDQLRVKGVSQYQKEDESVYQKRREYVKNFCKRRTSKKIPDPKYIRDITWYTENPKLLLCPIAKAGSTFWRRALEVIRRKDPDLVSPFELSYIDFHESAAKIPISYTRSDQKDKMSALMQSSLKFVFAREPYHRIFSTYVDKVLSPNPYMWGFGKAAIMKFRLPQPNGTKTCGSDATFEEYIKYINIHSSKSLDVHIRPVAYTCDVCDVNYDVIGKMETFQTDTTYILKKVKSYGHDIIFEDMKTEYKVDYVVINVFRAFSLKDSWKRCISVHAGLQRLWRQLQIGGLIDKRDKYPLTQEESNNITVTGYLNMALLAFRRSPLSAKENKREAFLQAYSTIPAEEMEKLRKQYTADFEMFDYEQRPKELFKTEEKGKTDFDFLDVIRLK